MGALKKETFVPMAFFKKEAYTGSFKGMRYRVVKAEDQFEMCIRDRYMPLRLFS